MTNTKNIAFTATAEIDHIAIRTNADTLGDVCHDLYCAAVREVIARDITTTIGVDVAVTQAESRGIVFYNEGMELDTEAHPMLEEVRRALEAAFELACARS